MGTTVTLQENENDDLFFELPEELLDTLGWDDNTEVEFTVIGNSIRISKVDSGRSEVD
jgi:antitoxin component of MazEF toxin-antitoxin module